MQSTISDERNEELEVAKDNVCGNSHRQQAEAPG